MRVVAAAACGSHHFTLKLEFTPFVGFLAICGFCKGHCCLDEQLELHSAYCYDRDGMIVDEPLYSG